MRVWRLTGAGGCVINPLQRCFIFPSLEAVYFFASFEGRFCLISATAVSFCWTRTFRGLSVGLTWRQKKPIQSWASLCPFHDKGRKKEKTLGQAIDAFARDGITNTRPGLCREFELVNGEPVIGTQRLGPMGCLGRKDQGGEGLHCPPLALPAR